MFTLKTVAPEEAQGKVKEVYGIFPPGVPVPAPMLLLSASPDLMGIQAGALKYFMGHPRLSFQVLAAIRYIASRAYDYPFCVSFNKNLLCRAGMSEDDFAALEADMADVPFEENETLLLAFVKKMVADPTSITKTDVDALRAAGWSDADILDAAAHAANLQAPAMLMKAFS
jgi:alkylhydroperoxidase family enzyme